MTLPSTGINVLAIWMTLLATGMTLTVIGKTLPHMNNFTSSREDSDTQFEFI